MSACSFSHRVSTLKHRNTTISIRNDMFYINDRPTYQGRHWKDKKIEGLLMNSRMIQGIFDDLNPETQSKWAYPDTNKWDLARNTNEFVAAMKSWRDHGLLSFTINLQGGSPEGYSKEQPWHNSAFTSDGNLRPEYMRRLALILDRADELGMAPILGLFYFGQDQRLRDETAVIRAVDNTVGWLFENEYSHVLIEINNECNVRYDHDILRPDRVHELIYQVKAHRSNGQKLYVSASYGGGTVPLENVVKAADFLLMHGNGVEDPDRITEMVKQARAVTGYTAKPILFNEDDHFKFDHPKNNMIAALSEYASWGFFDPGESNYWDGYQSLPVNWAINTERKKAFFAKLKEVTGEYTQ
ncbi:MAG: hypothetical protein JXB48_17000 [Candidatus Latescibacteria bacterium]|nr:hypothetical protein [Candidatus Latescibacterota bacterium]